MDPYLEPALPRLVLEHHLRGGPAGGGTHCSLAGPLDTQILHFGVGSTSNGGLSTLRGGSQFRYEEVFGPD